jgi:hypothetical protein
MLDGVMVTVGLSPFSRAIGNGLKRDTQLRKTQNIQLQPFLSFFLGKNGELIVRKTTLVGFKL